MSRRPTGLKIALQMSPEPSEEDLAFARQLGVRYVVLWTDAAHASAEYYTSRRKLFADAGLDVYGFGNVAVHNQDAIVLDLEDRDAKVEEYRQHLRALGEAGIPYTTYAHMANGIWSSARELTRGGASARALDLSKPHWGGWHGVTYRGEFTHGRRYSEDELWENYATFIREVAPVAEEAGVRIGIHPDDPPVPELGGVPRCIFGSFDGYERALEIADSPNVGMCLCVGCWLEGGTGMGRNVIETIRTFGEQGKLFKVHFRNVEAPLPHFVETFLDSGCMDMYQVVKALHEVRFDGVMIADHIPVMGGNPRVGTAYSIGMMKAWVQSLEAPGGARWEV